MANWPDDARYREFVSTHHARLMRGRLIAMAGEFLVPLPVYLPKPMGSLVLTRPVEVLCYLQSIAGLMRDRKVRFFDMTVEGMERQSPGKMIVRARGRAVAPGGAQPLAYRSAYYTTVDRGLIRIEMVEYETVDPPDAIPEIQRRFVEGVMARRQAKAAKL